MINFVSRTLQSNFSGERGLVTIYKMGVALGRAYRYVLMNHYSVDQQSYSMQMQYKQTFFIYTFVLRSDVSRTVGEEVIVTSWSKMLPNITFTLSGIHLSSSYFGYALRPKASVIECSYISY